MRTPLFPGFPLRARACSEARVSFGAHPGIRAGLLLETASSFTLPALAAVVALAAAGCAEAPSRTFRFEYIATVKDIPASATEVQVWVPLPQSDEAQSISDLEVEAPGMVRQTTEKGYGNRMAFIDLKAPLPAEVPVKVTFKATRLETRERSALAPATLAGVAGTKLTEERLLGADHLAPLTAEVVKRASSATEAGGDVDARARAIYDRVLADVDYDKSGQGWGRGDIQYVCDVGKGNCSDFHALFIGMARSQKIPAIFEIGFPLPRDKTEGVIGGYHCWAWYEVAPQRWHPVDASEADKDPTRKDYFFGTLCCNRVAFTRGRDIVLEPPQHGEPLNFFVYPYVEVDGKADVAKVEKTFSFQEMSHTS